ncbi:MAG TPA: aldose 1-epimerase family protein [Solirubrobacteraceae bacterium]|jgi:aldose 1-epimerase
MTPRVPPSGGQFELAAGDYRAVVVEVGAGLRCLEYQERALLDGYGAEEICEGARGQLLIPWPNRVEDGRYRFEGSDRQLSISEPERNCAIHGLVRWVPWTVLEREQARIVLGTRLHPHPGYPHVLDLRIDYRLNADAGLEMQLGAVNLGADPAPFGFGMHPYLTAGTSTIDSCELELPADRWLPTDDRGIPRSSPLPLLGSEFDFRSPRQLGGTEIDFAFCDLRRDDHGRATLTLRDPESGHASSLWVDSSIGWIEIFTGDHLPSRRREGLGVEPMSCPPNALASGEDLLILQPGESHTAAWGISV